MDPISYTAARANLARTMNRVCGDHEPLIITRNGQPSVVMLSLDDDKALEETAYLLRSPPTPAACSMPSTVLSRARGRSAACRTIDPNETNLRGTGLIGLSPLARHGSEAANRMHALIKETSRAPFAGTGKPESLRHALSGY